MSRATVHRWVSEALDEDVQRSLDRLSQMDDVQTIAVMPDVHLANEVCVGLAVATRQTLLPAAVGGDIGCGMSAIAFDVTGEVLSSGRAAASVLEQLYAKVPVTRHNRRDGIELPRSLRTHVLSLEGLERKKRAEATLQFGTLGRGNHFLEFQEDVEDGRLWLMVHSGSRGMGPAIRSTHDAEHVDGSGLVQIVAGSDAGRGYLSDVDWALEYAAESRRHMVQTVVEIVRGLFGVDADAATAFTCHHNFVRSEVHDGESLWVHRKGAISARDGEPGIIPGSMGASSFHVVGRGCTSSLCSSSPW